MNQLIKATAVFAIVWAGLSIFKAIAEVSEEEELARIGGGESDYEREHHKEYLSHLSHG